MEPTSSFINQENTKVPGADQPPTFVHTEQNATQPNIGKFKLPNVGAIFKIADPNAKKVLSSQSLTSSKCNSRSNTKVKKHISELYAEDEGPHWHKFNNPMITPPIVTRKLQNFFKALPIHGTPKPSETLKEFQMKKLQEFVGGGLNDNEYAELERYCNPDNLRTGKELKMTTKFPLQGLLTRASFKDNDEDINVDTIQFENTKPDLCILKKLKRRQERDKNNTFHKFLKYRGAHLLPLEDQKAPIKSEKQQSYELEPGKDTLYRIRMYRPFPSIVSYAGDKSQRSRHSVFDCDMVVCGRTSLAQVRDRVVCRNDLDMRLDVSDHPDRLPTATAKTVFPSGFLFINNVFYVDGRGGCGDLSAAPRRWARERALGAFPVRDMASCTLDNILLKLAYPEVYVHQGNCEHLFIFSEIRLLNVTDPLYLSSYPCTTNISQNQTTLCTTCAGFGAKWLVTGCYRVPFDPAFFCDTCFKQYLYIDGKKVDNFRAYHYTGNEVNVIKSQGSKTTSQSLAS